MVSRADQSGAHVVNLGGEAAHVSQIVDAIVETVPAADGLITFAETFLPFPDEFDLTGLDALGPVPVTSLRDGVAATVRLFEGLRDAVRLDPVEHGLAS